LIKKGIDDIIQGGSNFVTTRGIELFGKATCYVRKEDVARLKDLIRYAGGLAHESYHCKLYMDYQKEHPETKKVPKSAHSGEDAERQCLKYEIEVLKKLGADKKLIDYLENRAMKTRWWEVPSELREDDVLRQL